LIFHVNGPLDDGWATVGYWTSKAARDRFIQDRIMPAMAGRGEPPAIEDLELHNSLTEAAVGTSRAAAHSLSWATPEPAGCRQESGQTIKLSPADLLYPRSRALDLRS
jgi:hypothetical protein